jgi:DNA adenine methylase
MKSPLCYLGGKSRLAKTIIENIPDHTCYVEPFCGAAWVFFAKDPSRAEIINDRDSELITFWRVIQNHLEEFMRYYKFTVTSREIFELEKKRDTSTLTDIQRAARYFYLQKLGFGGKTTGRTFGTSATGPSRLNLLSMEDHLLEVHWRFKAVTIENLTARDCITRYDRPETFFYCDPPYYETAGYVHPFTHQDYIDLADTMRKIKGRFMVSLNEHQTVRDIFADFHIEPVKTKYSTGGARSAAGKASRAKDAKEVLIMNY